MTEAEMDEDLAQSMQSVSIGAAYVPSSGPTETTKAEEDSVKLEATPCPTDIVAGAVKDVKIEDAGVFAKSRQPTPPQHHGQRQ